MYLVNGVTVQTGDVLLKESAGGISHNLISLGQKIGSMSGGNANIVHAAIYVGSVSFEGVNYRHAIAESVGSGLRIANIDPSSTYHWRVWHIKRHAELRHLAADFASNLALRDDGQGQFGAYSKGSATKSAFFSSNPSKRGRGGGQYLERLERHVPNTRIFFCSNFVTLAYSLAAEALGLGGAVQYGIDLNYEFVSPAEMEKYFSRNADWTCAGTINGGGW